MTFVADQLFASPGGHPLYADLYLPDAVAASRPVIVWLHGGAWLKGDRRLGPNLSRHFAERGFAMVSVEYRLSQQARFPAQIEDVKTAIRWIRHVADRYALDPGRIGVWGSSAGAHLAALAAISSPGTFESPALPYAEHSSAVHAAVLGYPPVDFLQLSGDAHSPESQLLGAPVREHPDLAARANPATYAHDRVPPCLLLHGLRDTLIPASQSQMLYDALAARGNAVTLYLADDLAHGFLDDTTLDDRGPHAMTSYIPGHAASRERRDLFPLMEDFFRAVL